MAEQPIGDGPVAIPKALELAWGLDEPGTRGPKKGLTLDRVLDAAIEVADMEGLAALSMSRLAKQLGFTTMSLYRYVDSKDMLIELVSDRVIGPPPEFELGLGWRDALERWASAEFWAINQHPWWLEIPLGAPPAGPNNMAWLEAGLSALEATALDHRSRFQLIMNLTMYVMSRARLLHEMSQAKAEDEAHYPKILARVLDPERFPAIVNALKAGAFDFDDPVDWDDTDFTFGLERLLDGFEHFVAKQKA